VLAELRRYTGQDQMELDATELSVVNVDQFYGIEFGESYVRIPLQRSPHILHADALETDWSLHLPSS